MKFSRIDPLDELPKLKLKGKDIDPEHMKSVSNALEKLKEAEKRFHETSEYEEDEEGAFIPVSELRRNKRKERTPEQIKRAKLRKSASNQAICKNLRKESEETSDENSDASSSEVESEDDATRKTKNPDPLIPGPSGLSQKEKVELSKKTEVLLSGRKEAAKTNQDPNLPPAIVLL